MMAAVMDELEFFWHYDLLPFFAAFIWTAAYIDVGDLYMYAPALSLKQ